MFAEEIKNNLYDCIIPFWKNLKDDEFGGYYGYMDHELKLDKKAEKGCILNSRILWFFSNVYIERKDEWALAYAKQAYEFLKNYCLDKENGGVYWSCTYDGKPLDTSKHTYNQAFAIYALSSYGRAAKDKEALDLAMTLFHMIETKCRLDEGYGEEYTIDFKPGVNDKLSENNVIADKTMNTLLHILEAYTELYLATGDAKVKERLCFVLEEMYGKVYSPQNRRLEVFFDKDMNSLIDLHSYGHDIEGTWLIDRAIDALEDAELDKRYAPMLEDLVDSVYERAYKDGVFLPEAENGIPVTNRVWWVQCEAIVGFYNAYERTGQERYKQAAIDIWNYTKEKLIDKREGGEWFNEIDKDENIVTKWPIVWVWKCPYHNGRMCLEIIRRVGLV